MEYREITLQDIPALFAVRTATKENAFSREELTAIGVTEASVTHRLQTTHRGWLCQVEDQIVGFSIGDASTGELWVIAVLPEFEGKGIGSHLLHLAESWLWSKSCTQLWLLTGLNPALRAHQLYLKRGWIDSGVRDGQLLMKKARPA